MIDHVSIKVRDLAKSRAFYEQALAPLGYAVLRSYGDFIGLGAGGKPDLWMSPGTHVAPVHLAISSKTRALVDAFHVAALAAGGRDEGAPGLREQYHSNDDGAFVIDPDGNNLEVVCHLPA